MPLAPPPQTSPPMASSADRHRASPSAVPLISVHRAFGGGKAADVLLWRRKGLSAAYLVAATATWHLLGTSFNNLLPLLADAMLIAVGFLFFWAKSAACLQRPLPQLPNLEISDPVVEKIADELTLWIDAALGIAREIALGKDRKLFLKVVLILWALSYFGSLFSLVTWMYIVFLISMTVPALYDKHHTYADEKMAVIRSLAQKHCGVIFENLGCFFSGKEKKNE